MLACLPEELHIRETPPPRATHVTSLPPELQALTRPEAYAHPVDVVELIETHISWVLLAGEFAYKIKRPVCYPFLDMRSAERRRFLCEEELRLNRRFAPQLYLRVCQVVAHTGGARMDAEGAVLAHAVQMRRFDPLQQLDRLLERRRVEPYELEQFGRSLALVHERLPAVPSAALWGRPQHVRQLVLRNAQECAAAAGGFGDGARVEAVRERLEQQLPAAAAGMASRRASGCVRECHGDLHSRNIVRLAGRLSAFDCIEFEPNFRWIDVAEEIALLEVDLAARERPLHAHAFRSGYLSQSGDYGACRLLRLYEAHRALVRAKVAALSAAGAAAAAEAWRAEYDRLLGCAQRALEPQSPRLVLTCGLAGSGKTWLARALAPRLDAVHVRSDVERKRLAGLPQLARTHSQAGAGLYSQRLSEQLYARLADIAQQILGGGYSVIIDASFARRAHRALLQQVARHLGLPTTLIYCQAPLAVLRTRIKSRAQERRDPSEADEAVLNWQLQHFESLSPEEDLEVVHLTSSDGQAFEQLCRLLGPGLCR